MPASEITVGQLYGPLVQADDATRPVLVTAVEGDDVLFTRFSTNEKGERVETPNRLSLPEFQAWAGLRPPSPRPAIVDAPQASSAPA